MTDNPIKMNKLNLFRKCFSDMLYIKSSSLLVLQVVNDITTFYMQTYKNFETTKDERLKETLRVIQMGVSHCYTATL